MRNSNLESLAHETPLFSESWSVVVDRKVAQVVVKLLDESKGTSSCPAISCV